jgi:hypothetical protein
MVSNGTAMSQYGKGMEGSVGGLTEVLAQQSKRRNKLSGQAVSEPGTPKTQTREG